MNKNQPTRNSQQPLDSEQSALYANHDYDGHRWQRQQPQYNQHQSLSVAQPSQPSYNLYQPYYAQLQLQQQQGWRNTPRAERQRFSGPNVIRHAQHHGLPLPQPSQAQHTAVYHIQNQRLGRGNRSAGLDNPSNKGGPAGSRGGMTRRGRGARQESMSGNRGGMVGGRRDVRFSDAAGAHGSREKSGGAATMQAGGSDQSPNIVGRLGPVTGPAATQFQSAQCLNFNSKSQFMNAGGNLTATTVNNYGATHGLENLKDFVSFAALHDSAEQDPYRRCHPGTRENVLRRLRHWIDNPNPTDRIFWLHGPAGAGKSAIAQTIASGYHNGEVAATFFFYRSDPGRNDGNRLFTTIAWQLAFSIPVVKDLIVHALDKTPHLPTKNVEAQFAQLVKLPFQAMNNIVSQMPWLAPVIVIDGVDECSNEQLQRRFLTVIGNAVKDCCVPLRFLICSRPEALIEETLNQFKDSTLRIDLATLDDANRDIEKYLVDQFFVIASKQSLNLSWPGREIIQEIVFKSSGNFILASTLMRFIGDEDHSAVTQLDIIRKLKPHGTMSPFALLDELYLEILNRQLDHDFLKTFLALLIGRSSIRTHRILPLPKLYEDDSTLMNVSEKELRIKLRRMRSLLKFEPFIDVYHKSFLDFLQDSSRSAQYHVSKEGGRKRYLELIVDYVVRHISTAIEQPNGHEACRFSPQFTSIVRDYPSKNYLPVEGWQEALEPLLDLQDKLLKTSKPGPCRVAQAMRDLLLQLVIMQRKSLCISAAQMPESTKDAAVIERSTVLETGSRQNITQKDLDSCLSVLLSCLQKANLAVPFMVDAAMIDHMTSLLIFDHADTAARVLSVADAQNLIDFIDLLADDEFLLSQCGPDARRKATHLASEIFARAPVLPRTLFSNESCRSDGPLEFISGALESACQTALFCRILDHNYIVPQFEIYLESHALRFVGGNVNEQNESLHDWLERSNPNFVTRIQVMLEVARTIQYIHSMDIALFSFNIDSTYFVLDSNLRAKVLSEGSFTWWLRDASIYCHEKSNFWASFTYESNVSAFGRLFHAVCFDGDDERPPNRLVEDVRQLIERCRAKDWKSRPAMENVVKEMETWNLA